MNLRHLAVFHAVAETGGINRAAERLMISQPAVSRQVQTLEETLGVTLLERLPRGVRLTEAGRMLDDYARRLFAIEAQAAELFSDLKSLRTGSLRLGGSTIVGNYFLPEVIAVFHRRYPKIEISMEVGNTDAIFNAVRNNHVDIGFVEGPIESEEFEAQIFMQDELIVIAPPDHPLAGQGAVPFSRLCQHQCVMREHGSGTRATLNSLLEDAGVTDHAFNLTLGSPEAVKRAVQGGAGLAVASALTVVNELASGTLVHIPLSGAATHRDLYRITLPHKQLAPAAHPFLELVADYAVRYGVPPGDMPSRKPATARKTAAKRVYKHSGH